VRERASVVVLFDVDNTLLDNDRVIADMHRFMEEAIGPGRTEEYFAILEQLRAELGYVDYLGALQRYRVTHPRETAVLRISSWLVDYPFANRLFPGSLDVIGHAHSVGLPVVLSDGDVVFQPRKIERSGIWEQVDGRVLIYVHKEHELDDVELHFPARHYVLVDDKVKILDAVKQAWGERVTTVFPRQGHYALDEEEVARHASPDVTVERIGDLLELDLAELSAAAR
jgi:FMN phosphatase YigB (HAD superfamily)